MNILKEVVEIHIIPDLGGIVLEYYSGDYSTQGLGQQLQKYAQEGNYIIVDDLLKKRPDSPFSYSMGLYGACCGGYKSIIDLFTNKYGLRLSFGLKGASKGGHLDIFKEMWEKYLKIYNDSDDKEFERHNIIKVLKICEGNTNNIVLKSFINEKLQNF